MLLRMSRWTTKRTFALVDPHAEGDGRHDDVGLVAREGVLVAAARRVVEAGVIGKRRMPCSHSHSVVESTARRLMQ